MRITYVAKHGCGGNQDEDAISHALEVLGHRVVRIQETEGFNAARVSGDLCLFHKWEDVETLKLVDMPKVFWYFDLVRWPSDPTLGARCERRVESIERVLPYVDLGFMTDGDYVLARDSDKLHWLPQGADERGVGRGLMTLPQYDILFTGNERKCGVGRMEFVMEMRGKYGHARFHQVRDGVHGQALKDLIASSKIVVAPNCPVTNSYWSNRVYLTLGFGGFMLHPYCAGLTHHYEDKKELVYYSNMEDLYTKIGYYLKCSSGVNSAEAIAESGLKRTIKEHLYRHRLEKLLSIVQGGKDANQST